MKKEKLFKVGVINESTIDVVKDMATFYTSDTELWLGFELSEVGVEFDSAEILMFNIYDKSFVVRSVVETDGKYWYELDMDTIAHHGQWKAQLQFTKNSEVYTSKHFNFIIENDLSDERPPKLVDITNWSNIKHTADSLIAEMKVAVTEAIAAEQNREEIFAQAEQSRQTTFESNETARQTQELERENSETTRQQDEQERQSAELIRIENEKQRTLTYDGLQETIDSIGKIKLVNLVENGDFSDGLLGWKSHQGGVIEVVDSRLKIDTSPTNYSGVSQPINVKYDTNDIMYTNVSVYNPNHHDITLNFQFLNRTNLVKISPTFNGVVSVVQTSDTSMLSPRYFITKNSISDQYSFFIDNVILLNLTKIFGAGNEPTKETMDWIINTNGYFDELAIVRDDIQQYEINQLRKAVLALGGTI